ncbi:MAG: hypothetical protein HYU44_11415 [Betaproteobacteria bacterium]|nr:hypothetical protein [Betaproteobacteria bacterium]
MARALRLWQEFSAAYAVCFDAHVRGDSGVRNYGALIVMRCLRYTSSAMFEHYRAYRHAPGELWKQLHQYYAFAEQGGFARTMVVDAFNRQEADSSCATTYRQALLVQLGNPFALSGRQLETLARWSASWNDGTPASGESAAADSWQLVNQSGSGFMCMVREPGAETRISHNQLVCVHRGSDNSSCLRLVLWLRVTEPLALRPPRECG